MDLRLQLSEVRSNLNGDGERGAGRRAREAMKGGELSRARTMVEGLVQRARREGRRVVHLTEVVKEQKEE